MMIKRIAFALACIFLLSTCKKEDDPQPEVPVTSVNPMGPLTGKINQYDQFGTIYTSGLNTTTVSIENRAFTTITDTSGIYTFSGVPSNTYTLVFKKPGCGLIKRQNMVYKAGDTTTFNATISDIPTFTLSSAYAKDTTWFSNSLGGVYYHASSAPTHPNATVVAIIGKKANMDISNPASYLNYTTASLLRITDFSRFFSYPLLRDTYSFKKDSLIYIKIYPVSSIGASYFDNDLKIPIFTSYGTPYSSVLSVTIP